MALGGVHLCADCCSFQGIFDIQLALVRPSGNLVQGSALPDRFTRRAKHKSHFSLKRFEFFLFFSSKCVSERALKRDNAVVPLNTFSTV